MDRVEKMLIDNNMSDGSILVFCTKWNAFIGPQYITVQDDNLYITPVNALKAKIKDAIKLNKNEIAEIVVTKSIWTGPKIAIVLKDGRQLGYRLINNSWVEPANQLKELWFQSPVKIVKTKMTVGEAFLLDCRVTAKQLLATDGEFTLSQLVHKVVDNDKDAEEWIRIYGDKIYNAIKDDIKTGKIEARIILTKRGEEIVYPKIKFLKK